MGLVVAALEDVVLAGLDVVVAAGLDGAGAHEVLEHGGNGLIAPAEILRGLVVAPRGLHAAAVGLHEVAGERGVLGLGAVEALDSGVGVEVDLGSQVDGDAGVTPSAARPHARLAPEILVHKGSEAAAGGDAQRGIRVGGVHVRNAERTLLAQALDLVDPLDIGGVGLLVGSEAGNARRRTLGDEAELGILGALGLVGDAAVEHELDAVVVGQVRGEVDRAVVDGLAPVLEEVELAAAIKILERKAVDLDDLGLVHHADHDAVGVGHAEPAVAGLLGGPKGLHILAVRIDGVRGCVGRGIRVARRLRPASRLSARIRCGASVCAGSKRQCADPGRRLEEVPSRQFHAHSLSPFENPTVLPLR